jgi:hypothetical protein
VPSLAPRRAKARNIGREETKPDIGKLAEVHVTAPVLLLGKTIRLLPTEEGELRAADGDLPADAAAGARYLTKRSASIWSGSGPRWSNWQRATSRTR